MSQDLLDGVAARQISLGLDAALLQPVDRFVEHLAKAVIVVDQTGVPADAGEHHRIHQPLRNDGQHVNPRIEQNREFGAALERAAARL